MSMNIRLSFLVVLYLSLLGASNVHATAPVAFRHSSRQQSKSGSGPFHPIAKGGNGLASNSDMLLSVRGGNNSDGSGALKTFLDTIRNSRKHLIAAGVARCISIFTMFPVDTIKTRLQMGFPTAQVFNFQGLYKGVGGSLVGQVPYGVLTFGSYEMYKTLLLDKFGPDSKFNLPPALLYAFAAIGGDVTGSGWICPSEVVKQQSQAGMYDSTTDAIRGIYAKKGLGGFYQGYMGGLARDVPFRVAQLVSYEITKNFYLRLKKKDGNDDEGSDTLSATEAAICGAVAGTFSSAITSPLDRIKTLLMTDSGGKYGSTVSSCISTIWKEEGVKGLCQGLAPRVVYIAPSVAIFFLAYEQVQQRLS